MSNLGNQQLGDIILGESFGDSITAGYGQAQASVLQTYFGHANAQARILQIYQGYGQSQGEIVYKYWAHAQAQAYISVSWGFAQAQSTILQTYFEFGQAQSSIVYKRWAHGQAQTYIRSIIFDAATESIMTASGTSHSFSHTPVGIPRAIVVSVVGLGVSPFTASITYGGVPMTRVARGSDTATEVGHTDLWFLGTNIPTGTQTVEATLATITSNDFQFVAMSFLANRDTEPVFYGSTGGDIANPYLVATNFGRISQGIIATFSGVDAPSSIAEQTGWTLVHDHDFTSQSAEVARQNNPSDQDEFMGFTIALEDNAFAVLTFSEVIPHPQVFAQALAFIDSRRAQGQAQARIIVGTNIVAQAAALIDSLYSISAYGQAAAQLARYVVIGNAQGTILAISSNSGQAQAQIAGLQHGQAIALIANAGVSSYYNVVMGDNPAAYYRFTETVIISDTGVRFFDSAGDYDLTKPNSTRGPISISDGILNTTETKGIDNKTTDTTPYNGNYLYTSSTGTQPDGTSPLSSKFNWAIEAWVKLKTTANVVSTDIITVGGWDLTNADKAGSLSFDIDTNERIQARYSITDSTGSGIGTSSSFNTPVTTTEFTHAVFTRGEGLLKLYVNGVLVATGTGGSMIDPNPLGAIAINGNISTNQTLRYILDEVAIYTHELEPGEVLEHFRIGSGRNVWYGQAQALITTTLGSGNANAKIWAFDFNRHGLARAKIHRYEGYGIALARIKLEAHNTANAYQDMIIADNPVSYIPLNDALTADISIAKGSSTTDTDYENRALDLVGSYDLWRVFVTSNRGPYGGQTGIPFLEGIDSAVINRDSVSRATGQNALERNTNPSGAIEPIAITGPAINWAFEIWWELENNNGNLNDIAILEYGAQNSSTAGYVGLKYSTTTGRIRAIIRTGVDNIIGQSGPIVAPSEWHHIVLTRGTGNVSLYIDGVLITNQFVNMHNFVRDTILGLTISGDVSQYKYDEFAIYNHELDADTVGQHYLMGMSKGSGFGQAAAEIYAYRPVGQAAGAIQKDGYGFGNTKAHIIFRGFGRGQAQAKIIYKQSAHGQAEAYILDPTVFIGPYGNAQAIIGYEIFYDTFSRVVPDIGAFGQPSNIGTPDLGAYDTSFTGYNVFNPGTTSEIDGFTLINYISNEDDLQGTELTPLVVMHDGVYSIDFKYPVIPADDFLVSIVVAAWDHDFTPSIDVEVDWNNGTTARLYVNWSKNTSPFIDSTFVSLPAFEADTYYTVKFAVFGQTASAKIWKRDEESEPDWMVTNVGSSFSELWDQKGFVFAYAEASVFGETLPFVEILDNFNIVSTDALPTNMGLGLAVANIKNGNRGLGQAQALIDRQQRHANTQARILAVNTNKVGQARAKIMYKYWSQGQAQAMIIRIGHGQAMAAIQKDGFGFAQAQAWIIKTREVAFGQARARIKMYAEWAWGQALAQIRHFRYNGYGQALALLKGNHVWGQANAWIAYGSNNRHGQARALIDNKTRYGQAAALILAVIGPGGGGGPGPGGGGGSIIVPAQTYLVEYNGYTLPGFAQSESLESGMLMKTHVAAMVDGSLTEYMGLENKLVSLEMRVWDSDYIQVKKQVQKAGVILRSKRDDYAKLRLHYADRYYLALVKKVSMDKEARSSNFIGDYEAQFESKPWLYSEVEHEISGTGLITTDQVSRTIDNGGWSPVTLEVSGTNITISGYTATESYAGYITISGAVSNMEIDTEFYSATMAGQNMNEYINRDYELYVGPSKTYFNINGASSCIIRYRDRWYL